MSDVKNYIVQYDIRANTEQAAVQLREIMQTISGVDGPMKTLQQTLSTLNSTLTQLKSNQNLKFTPTIETASFDGQLKKMLLNVQSTAKQMHVALYGALQGNAGSTNAMKKSAVKTLGSRTAAEVKSEIEGLRKEYDKLLGEPVKVKGGKIHRKDGLITYAKNALALDPTNQELQNKLSELQAKKGAISNLLKQRNNELKSLQEAESKIASTQTRASKPTSTATTAVKPQSAKLTNVTPAVIREWGKVFGNDKAKSLTVNIRGNAKGPNGAMTVISSVKEALGTLEGLGKFNITANINRDSFNAVATELGKLKTLSQAVMAPFTGDTTKKQGATNTLAGLTKEEQEKLTKAQASVADYKKKIDDVQRKLYATQQKYDKQPTSALKGQITRSTNQLAEYRKGLSMAQYDIDQLQTKAAQTVQPTTKNAQPITVNVTGNLTGINAAGKEFPVNVIGQIQKLQPPKNVEIPVAVKIAASQVKQSLKSIPRPELPVSIKLMWNKGAIGKQEHLKAIQDKVPPIKLDLNITPALEKLETFIGQVKANSPQTITLAASGAPKSVSNNIAAASTPVGTSVKSKAQTATTNKNANTSSAAAPIANLGTAKPKPSDWLAREQARRAVELDSMRRSAMSVFGQGLTPYEESEWKRVFDESNRRDDARRKQNTIAHQRRADALRSQAYNSILPFVNSQGQANELMKYRKYFREAVTLSGITPTANMPSTQKLAYLKTAASWIETNKKQIPYQLTDEIKKLQSSIDKENKTVAERQKRAKSATSMASHQNKIDAMRSRLANAALPFVQNQSQLNDVIKYRKIFNGVARLTGFDPENAAPSGKLDYLKNVKSQMQIQSVQTPMWLQNEINRLEAERKASIAQTQRETAAKNERVARENYARRLAKRQARISNAALPFVQNQGQLNTVVKNWKYFQQAITSTGITPTQGMAPTQMLKYLQGVSQLMQKANVQIPMQLQTAINKLQAQVLKATQAATQLASATTAATKATSKMQTVRVAEKPVSSYGRIRKWAYPFTGNTSFGATTPMAVDMAKGMGVMFAVGGAMSAVGNSFSEAVEYQNTMRTTNAILKNGTDTYSPSAFAGMERTVRDVGIKTKFSAPEVASAARFLAMAGYDINAINHSIQAIADLALIGDTDLGETADKMTNIMTTFGIKPEKMREAANIMTTTATRSNTDLMMLAESARYGGGVANMYGKNDPNLFADTMALFGIMGNAGIQASSAGTALRMMYQNIFKPNKNQKAVLDMLDKAHGIKTTYWTEDGKERLRSISDILIDIANKVSPDEMPKVVGNLFRITAQPGAAAALNAAAQEDGTDATQVAGGIDAVSKFVGEKGLSSLVELMLANRASVTSNISQNIALEKQNTIKGLWAQVTSTFTEGILKAFEANTGYFEEMLGNLRDYLARPETTQMIQKLFDMIISIGKMMAKFVEIWVGFYEKFEPIVKAWIVSQLFFTQVGSLITPLVAAISVIDRLRGSLLAFSGIAPATTAINEWKVAATAAKAATISKNAAQAVKRNASVPSSAVATNTVSPAPVLRNKSALFRHNLHSQLMMHGLAGASAAQIGNYISNNGKNTVLARLINKKRSQQTSNPELMSRLASMQMQKGGLKGWTSGFSTAYRAGMAYMSLTGLSSMLASIKTLFKALFVSLGKAIGLLINPFTIATGAVIGLGTWLYKLGQYADSATEAQIKARKKLSDDFTQSFKAEKERRKNTKDFLAKNNFLTERVSDYTEDVEGEENEKKNKWFDSYKYLFNKDITTSEGASRKANKDIVESLRKRYANDVTMRLALGVKEYDELLGSELTIATEEISKGLNQITLGGGVMGGAAGLAIANSFHNKVKGERNAAVELMKKAAMLAVKNEGANDEKILSARQEIIDLRKKLGNTEEFRTQALAIVKKVADIDAYSLLGDEFINIQNLGNENFDWSRLYSYVYAGYKTLMAEIEGSSGSAIELYLAVEELKRNAIPNSKKWADNMRKLLNNQKLLQTVFLNGVQYDDIEVWVKTLPDGNLDFSGMLKQIQDKVKGFKGNTELFFEMADKVYDMLIKLKVIEDTGLEGRAKWVSGQTKDVDVTNKDVQKYGPAGVDIGGLSVSPSDVMGVEPMWANTIDNGWVDIQQQIADSTRYNMAKKIGAQHYGSEENTSNGKTAPYNPNPAGKTTPGSGNDNKDNPDPTKQDPYKSTYDRSSARPTQIVFNINNLANFDRTTIAASAEERELIASMESKISDAVYRIFAEAANSANNMLIS